VREVPKTEGLSKVRGSKNDRKALAAHWVERANGRLLEARLMMRRGWGRAAVPSAYFAIHAAMRALLRLKGVNLKNPRRAFSSFNNHYVRPDLFPQALMVEAETVGKIRELADYYELAPIPKAQARYAVTAAARFVAAVEKFIKNNEPVKRKGSGKTK